MRLLIICPNSTNTATVSNSIPILAGIAKWRNWEVDYFDTYLYEKQNDQESVAGKSKTGGFKPSFVMDMHKKAYSELIPDLQKKLVENTPNLIAITCLSPEYNFLMKFFDKVKIPPETKVVIGGIHATLMGEETIKTGLFDLVALGEGEETFNDILRRLEFHHSLKEIPGTYYYDRNVGTIEKNPLRMLLSAEKLWEIDRDFSLFDEAYFFRPFDGKKIKRSDIEIARGCPYHCTYCGNRALKAFNKGLGKYVKARPVHSCIKEMKHLLDNYGIDIFAFQDECFLSHPTTWIKDFMNEYKKVINKPFTFMTRPETITEDKVKMLLEYGIPFQTSIGVESGSDNILLNVCDRSATRKKIIKAFNILNKYKIRTNTFFIVGFPFERRIDTYKSIILCKKIRPSVASVSIFQPYPGQELTKVCVEKGFVSKDAQPGTFVSDSLLDMPKPYLSKSEITNMWRVFMLYAVLPKKYRKDIEKCEVDYENNQELYNNLMKLRWDEFDLSKIKGDIKMV